MVMQDIRRLSNEELQKELAGAYRELMNVRFRLATRQLANVREESRVKKRIARMKTVLRQRQLGIGA